LTRFNSTHEYKYKYKYNYKQKHIPQNKQSTMVIFCSSTLLLLVLANTPGSDAFRNGNNAPQADPKVSGSDAVAISKPPMPRKWPIVGTLPDFFSRGGVDGMCEVHESMYEEFGPVYGMSLMGTDEIVFSDPRVLDQVLRKEGKFPIGGAESVTTFADYYTENNMDFALQSVQHGPQWKEYRMALNPDMYVLWDTYLPTIAETCKKISIVAGKEVTETKNQHFADFLSHAAFDMFSAVLYGESPETTNTDKATPEDVAFVSATKTAFDITGNLIANPLEKVFGSDLYKDFVVNMDKTVDLAKKRGTEKIQAAVTDKALHDENVKSLEQAAAAASAATTTTTTTTDAAENESESGSSGCPIAAIKKAAGSVGLKRDKVIPTDFVNPSFIERLVHRDNLSLDQIAETQTPLLMAGVDTTAYVMSWFYLNMASNPDIQTKLANELKETLNGADVTTVEQMESLTYLKQCFRESHRLTPTAPISIKTIEQDIDVVTNDKAYTIPAGQRISLNLRGLPMDPVYVENPTAFSPERFSQSAIEARRGTPSAVALDHPYMNDPFGRGKRRCLGANVAIAEMMVLAARLLQDWEISLEDPSESFLSPTKTWKSKQKLMLIADPYPNMKLVPRKQ
jgi:cytochrome P450